jgi:hypothetical protein
MAVRTVHHRCITRAVFDDLLRPGGLRECRMVERDSAALAKNPAYRPAKETPANAGVSILSVHHRCITQVRFGLGSGPKSEGNHRPDRLR